MTPLQLFGACMAAVAVVMFIIGLTGMAQMEVDFAPQHGTVKGITH